MPELGAPSPQRVQSVRSLNCFLSDAPFPPQQLHQRIHAAGTAHNLTPRCAGGGAAQKPRGVCGMLRIEHAHQGANDLARAEERSGAIELLSEDDQG